MSNYVITLGVMVVCSIFSSATFAASAGADQPMNYYKYGSCKQLYFDFKTTVWEDGQPVTRLDKVNHDEIKQYIKSRIISETQIKNIITDFVYFMNNVNKLPIPAVDKCAVEFDVSVTQGYGIDYVDLSYYIGRHYYSNDYGKTMTVIASDSMPTIVRTESQKLGSFSSASATKATVIKLTKEATAGLVCSLNGKYVFECNNSKVPSTQESNMGNSQ